MTKILNRSSRTINEAYNNGRLIRTLFVFLLLAGFLSAQLVVTYAETTGINMPPYPNVNYGYSTSVETGTIRYMSQISGSSYFNNDYWGDWIWKRIPDVYSGPGYECGTCSMSMALSYIGINKTPDAILSANNGVTYWTGWGVDHSQPSIEDGMARYINENGKYSPLVIKLPGGGSEGNDHFVVVAGKSGSTLTILDPAIDSIMTATVSGSYVTYRSSTYYISETHQWYNPSAQILETHGEYPCDITLTASQDDANGLSYWTLPGNTDTYPNSTYKGKIPNGTNIHAKRIIKNVADHYWYEIEWDNSTCYVYEPYTKNPTQNWTVNTSGVTGPDRLNIGDPYTVTGTLSTNGCLITSVIGYIYKGATTSGSASQQSIEVTPNSNTYNLAGIDSSLYFNNVSTTGTHTYAIKVKLSSWQLVNGTPTLVQYNNGGQKVAFSKQYELGAASVRLTLDANGGVVSNYSITYNSGDQLGELPYASTINENDPYIFDGWYTERNGGTKVTANTTITDNMTVYAHWVENYSYKKISFAPNGGSYERLGGTEAASYTAHNYVTGEDKTYSSRAAYLAENKYVYWGENHYYEELPVPAREGYVFAGWLGEGRRVTYTTGAGGPLSLTAMWAPIGSLTPASEVEFNGHIYQRYDYNARSWEQAEALCESMGGHLVSITDSDEQNTVVGLLSGCPLGVYYIGATDAESEGVWKWVTGESVSYNNWDKSGGNEPDGGTAENCSTIMGKNYSPNKVIGEWADIPNVEVNGYFMISNCGFICEYDVPPCEHSYTILDIVLGTGKNKVPTLTEGGYFTYRCTLCGEEIVEYYPALNDTDYAVEREESTCTENGYEHYVYMGDDAMHLSFDKAILPLAPHQYESVNVPPIAGKPGYMMYTCSVCGGSYKEYASDEWTNWSEMYPSGVDASLIESKTQYRVRTKETTTSPSSSLDGWTLYDTSTGWGAYGAWSEWGDIAISSDDSTDVEPRTVYPYYYFYCTNCGLGARYPYSGVQCEICGRSDTVLASTGTVEWYTNPWSDSTAWGTGTGKYYQYIDGSILWNWEDGAPKTQYRSRTREMETTYHYYRWTEWSEWGDQVETATDEKEVETRIVYRYAIVPSEYPDNLIIIPAGTSVIEQEAFYGVNAEYVYIPATVSEIKSLAFAACPNLKVVYFESGNNITVAQNFVSGCSRMLVIDAPDGSAVAGNASSYRQYLAG